jgi:ABC-type branched-subunit amino acid transport system substrate-binding protein
LELRVHRTDADSISSADTGGTAWLVAGHFEHDVKVVHHVASRQPAPLLVAAVAAGIRAFGCELGTEADGICGPAQWWPDATTPAVGPSGMESPQDYRARTGYEPSYVAAQADAAGFLARATQQRQLSGADITQWTTSTLLGDFQPGSDWRQVGHHITTVRWRDGQLVRA